jgi:replicative DNA helicase
VALNDDPRTALRYDDFGDGTRQRYWQVVLDLLATEVRPDVTVVADRAYRLGFHDVTLEWLEATRAYLRVHGVDSVANAPYWAKAVRESSDWRGVRQAAEDIYGLTVDRTRLSLPEARARALQLVTRIRTAEQEETGYAPLGAETDDLLTDVDDWFEGRPVRSLTTGFPSLDEYLGGGMRPARLVLLGGRPGMMKTAFGLHLVHNVAAGLALTGEKGCVAVQSLEMERGDLNLQMACRYAGVDMRLLTAGRLARAPERQAMRAAVAEELERIRALPIMVDHTDSVSSDQIYFRVSLLHAANPIKLLVIDYAELVGDEAEAGEEIRVSGIFRRAKALAKGLKIPVILLCQLNRQVEGRMNKMPASSDIRYSGSAEAVADYVWLCFDPWKYKEMGQEVEPGSDFRGWEDGKRWYLVIAKARYGRVGFIELRRDAPLTLLKDPLADEVRFGSDPLLRGGNGVWLPGLEVGGGDRRGRDTVQAQNVDRGQPAETSWRLTGDGRALPGA